MAELILGCELGGLVLLANLGAALPYLFDAPLEYVAFLLFGEVGALGAL